MPETALKGRRASQRRIDEAVELGGVGLYIAACPKDVAMYDVALMTRGHQGAIELRDFTCLLH